MSTYLIMRSTVKLGGLTVSPLLGHHWGKLQLEADVPGLTKTVSCAGKTEEDAIYEVLGWIWSALGKEGGKPYASHTVTGKEYHLE